MISKTLKIALILSMFLGLNACNTAHKHTEPPNATMSDGDYYCPMDTDVVGKKGDNCSKCGMALVENKVKNDSTSAK
jgi:hypothetical protein